MNSFYGSTLTDKTRFRDKNLYKQKKSFKINKITYFCIYEFNK